VRKVPVSAVAELSGFAGFHASGKLALRIEADIDRSGRQTFAGTDGCPPESRTELAGRCAGPTPTPNDRLQCPELPHGCEQSGTAHGRPCPFADDRSRPLGTGGSGSRPSHGQVRKLTVTSARPGSNRFREDRSLGSSVVKDSSQSEAAVQQSIRPTAHGPRDVRRMKPSRSRIGDP
jgi:hypothetical protein